MIKGKNILVAGGTGLVGSWVVRAASERGADVLASYYSRRPDFFSEKYRYFNFEETEDCLKATKGMDYVFLCAAKSFGSKVMKEDPALCIAPNLKINLGLLEACRINKVKKVVLVSSSTVYQEATHPISEAELDLDKPPYGLYFAVGWLNRYIEKMAGFYNRRYGIEVGIARPSSIYGPGDKFDEDISNVIPALIKRAMSKETPFIIWGDGSQVRDFIYVEDLAADLFGILEKYCIADPVNLGSGSTITIRDAAGIILESCGHPVSPHYDTGKPSAIPYRALDMKKRDAVLGPRSSTAFRDGIKKTIEWYGSRVQFQESKKQ